MAIRQPRYSMEDHARLGQDLYDRQVRSQVEAGNLGRVVAIDVDSGAYAVAEDTLSAASRLLSLHPDAQIWCIRIGDKGVHRFGGANRIAS